MAALGCYWMPLAAQRFVDDLANGRRAVSTPRFATETKINATYRVCPLRLDSGADSVIAQQIARADDHGAKAFFRSGSIQ